MYSFAQTIFVTSWPWMKMVHSLRVLPFHFIVQQHLLLLLIYHHSKRTLFSSRNTTISRQQQAPSTKTTCWFRITRLASAESPPKTTPAVREYLRAWSESSQQANITKLLQEQQEQQNAAPPVPTGFHSNEIKRFLRQYKKYQRRASVRMALEPLYNRLFEWLVVQQQQQGGGGNNGGELVWGMGLAHQQLLTTNGQTIHGPLLEVLVEVELSRDGALLIRPRPHTGVALNREVVTALLLDAQNHDVLSSLHRTVAELETDQISPGEPSTYTPLLKRMAHELSSNGVFSVTNTSSAQQLLRKNGSLVVTDAWCLYHRPKPSTVWARDACVLAERIVHQQQQQQQQHDEQHLPMASWALTHGPTAMSSMQQQQQEEAIRNPNAIASSGSAGALWGRIVKSACHFCSWTRE